VTTYKTASNLSNTKLNKYKIQSAERK